VTEHSGATYDFVKDELKLEDTPNDIVTIHGRDDVIMSLERAIYDVVTVASTLSHVAALLRPRDQGPVIHPETKELREWYC
jgi:hypothetical protein